MEICPKQQDTALNLLIKSLKFSHMRVCRCQRAGPGSSASPAATAARAGTGTAQLGTAQPWAKVRARTAVLPLCSLSTSSSLKTRPLKTKSAKQSYLLEAWEIRFIGIQHSLS